MASPKVDGRGEKVLRSNFIRTLENGNQTAFCPYCFLFTGYNAYLCIRIKVYCTNESYPIG